MTEAFGFKVSWYHNYVCTIKYVVLRLCRQADQTTASKSQQEPAEDHNFSARSRSATIATL